MNEAVSPFEEPWPDDEMRLVADAVRAAVAAPRPVTTDAPSNGADGPTGKFAANEFVERALVEAGHRWARAHQSASLMRSRLDALEVSMDSEVDAGTDADRAAYHRAWRTVIDAATWTSLNQLEEAALLDPLTGVGNRRALDLMLTRAMSGARRAGSELVVVAIDLDGLKRINDSRGHAEGDRTLTSLVDAIGEGLRTSDTVFRTGGDEFAVVLQGIGLGEVEPLMHRISAGGTPQFTWGAASLAADHQQPSELLDAADADLYRRRGVDRALVGAGAVSLAGAGAVVDLRRPKGSAMSRVSRRASVAVAAGLVAIGGTLAAVTTLSPGTQTALPPKHHTTTPTTQPSGGNNPPGGGTTSTSAPTSPTSPFSIVPPSNSGTAGGGLVSSITPSTTAPTTVVPIPSGQTGPSGTTTPSTTPPTTPGGTTPPTPTGAVSGLVVGLETTVNSTVFGLVSALGLGGLVAAPKK
ncbi:MAG TPA: GGDEF domain-containing protein [Acidimicrobiales bacterium]|jgi:diguanylate cyclase (GGDEF)-like protein|nr:GGDEF domain-containing protein [Acidimicrobiales bacterium]